MFSGAGTTMAPHVIRINAGEDIKRRIVSVLHGRRAVVLLSAIGSISAASIRSSSSTGSVTYEGHFDMVNLSGSYINDPADGLSGGLNVTFAGSDGRLIGGPVDGLLIAATPVQVIVGVLVPSSSSSAKPKAKDNYSSEGGFTESQNLAPWQS
ncbi:hypothetical protein M569_09606 [Genlisea aurea]|uniref:AT-hook motif nuclear-localized protein n=1 Tax=Genlisea aurea TaxID=192259 RepID=S8CKF7_9LAMI|nr:hypothetical protein M569_09606 [Genlisea aurea]